MKTLTSSLALLIGLAGWWSVVLPVPLQAKDRGAGGSPPDWRRAEPGWDYAFPRDHHAHPQFKTEWWYFTGNLKEKGTGRPFGFQWTVFRQGLMPPGMEVPDSAWLSRSFYFGHFTVTDLETGAFHFDQILSRGAFDETAAGAPGERLLVRIKDWSLEGAEVAPDFTEFFLKATATTGDYAVDFSLRPGKAPVINGVDGVSKKSAGEGNASHYYSVPRLETSGELRLGEETFEVAGQSWLDREWSTSVLAENQVGWDWLSLHLSDGTDLMLYRLRRDDGTPDPFSSGTLSFPDGSKVHLENRDFTLAPGRTWKSPATGAVYPMEWEVKIPAKKVILRVAAAQNNQELAIPGLAYWEGAVSVSGERDGTPVDGEGYLEMTGYAQAIRGLR